MDTQATSGLDQKGSEGKMEDGRNKYNRSKKRRRKRKRNRDEGEWGGNTGRGEWREEGASRLVMVVRHITSPAAVLHTNEREQSSFTKKLVSGG